MYRLGQRVHAQKLIHTLVGRGERVNFKKCQFQAALMRIDSLDDVESALSEVIACRKVAKSTHPHIAAWRVSGDVGGFTDCGESGAGRRLLALLESRKDENTLIAVTRWYGGSHLGSSRFRAISSVAKDLLSEHTTKGPRVAGKGHAIKRCHVVGFANGKDKASLGCEAIKVDMTLEWN
jgi:putative IMPACT (imprinted ancient) family translation regulator